MHVCVEGWGAGRGGGCQRGPFANCTLFVSSTCSSFVAPLNLHQTVSRREPHIGSAANLPLQGRRGGVCALPILWFPRQSLGVLTVLTFVPNVSRKARAAPRCPELASRAPTRTHPPKLCRCLCPSLCCGAGTVHVLWWHLWIRPYRLFRSGVAEDCGPGQ